MRFQMKINGVNTEVEAKPNNILMHVLREMGYYGVKNGCEEGVCGTCVILVDGIPKKACLLFIGQVQNRELTTIEGIGTPEKPHPIQDQFVEKAGIQCGFCIPGMIMSAVALLEVNPDPSEMQIKEGIEGNLCRCTGYPKQIEAIREAAKIMREAGD